MKGLNFKGTADLIEKSEIKTKLSTILFVDDEPQNLKIYCAIALNDFNCIVAGSAEEAIEIVEKEDPEEPIAAVICDHIMPLTTGIELCIELKKRHHLAERIILTGFADLESAMTAVNEANIYRFLTKPINDQDLLEAIKSAVALFEERREAGRMMNLIKGLMETNSELTKTLMSEAPERLDELKKTSPSQTSPRRIKVVALFADVRGFTKMSCKMEAEQVIEGLQKIFEKMHGIIYDSGGIVDKHLGDGLLAIYGFSGEYPQKSSLQALEKLVDATPSFYNQLPEEFQETKIAYGLACGDIVSGVLGSKHRTELAVIGNCINRAARLQELTKRAILDSNGPLGEFKKAMAICDADLLYGGDKFKLVELSNDFSVRDFPEIRQVGVYNGPS